MTMRSRFALAVCASAASLLLLSACGPTAAVDPAAERAVVPTANAVRDHNEPLAPPIEPEGGRDLAPATDQEPATLPSQPTRSPTTTPPPAGPVTPPAKPPRPILPSPIQPPAEIHPVHPEPGDEVQR